MHSKPFFTIVTSLICAVPLVAKATNGMNLEGFGPIATAMGGSSMAYDNGTAAMMNNPATLGLMDDTQIRVDLALGLLGPNVNVETGVMNAGSDGDAYIMPAFGWVTKRGRLAYGVGIYSQGGMGTEYSENGFLAAGTGQDARSEVGVSRLLLPFAYSVNERLNVGASIDWVWGGLDMKMPMAIGSGQPGTFSDFLTGFGGSQILGEASVTPGLATSMGNAVAAGYDAVAINFSDGSDFTQESRGSGFGGKIGVTYKLNRQITLGGAYHMKTMMDDWSGNATLMMYDTDGSSPASATAGKITIKDFQWPATWAAGLAYTPNSRWLLAADFKLLKWSDVMQDFNLTFESGGESADITFYQDWEDQNVLSLGGAYRLDDHITLRAGLNFASNPVPDRYLNPLFPAIVESHYMAGIGYSLSKASDLNFAMSYAPTVEAANSTTGMKVSHNQFSWQLMYSHLF